MRCLNFLPLLLTATVVKPSSCEQALANLNTHSTSASDNNEQGIVRGGEEENGVFEDCKAAGTSLSGAKSVERGSARGDDDRIDDCDDAAAEEEGCAWDEVLREQSSGTTHGKPKPTYIDSLSSILQSSLHALDAKDVTIAKVESWSIFLYESMSTSQRNYHDVQHIFDVLTSCGLSSEDDDEYGSNGGAGPSPIEIISILFHDIINFQIDGQFSKQQKSILDGVVKVNEKGGRWIDANGSVTISEINIQNDPLLAMTATIFNIHSGQTLHAVRTGANEFSSTIIVTRILKPHLSLSQLVQIMCCIEATIPFRGIDKVTNLTMPEGLYHRLELANEQFQLNLTDDDMTQSVQSAVRVANCDVHGFAATDHSLFLDNGWNLMSENSPTLRNEKLFTVSDYQLALNDMMKFFHFVIKVEVVFHHYHNVPDDKTLSRWMDGAKRNIEIGKRYMSVVLLSVAVIGSIAELTGGDGPYVMFMGEMPSMSRVTMRLDDYLPPTPPTDMLLSQQRTKEDDVIVDETVMDILTNGRNVDAKFDLRKVPLAAYLYNHLGDVGVMEALTHYVSHPMDMEHSKRLLFEFLPYEVVDVILGCMSKVTIVRSERLRDLLKEREITSDSEGS